jgi:hypothetical protein
MHIELKAGPQQNDKPSRSEAIPRLIEFALAAKIKRQNTGDK